jgi:predicted membrane protein
MFWGLLLVGAGLIWLLNNVGAIDFDFGEFVQRAWPVIIIALGVWMLTGSSRRRVQVEVVGAPAFTSKSSESLTHGLGEVEMAPESIDSRGLEVKVGAGEVKLDLRQTRFADGESSLHVKLGLGDVRIDLPRDLPVAIDAKTGGGDLHLLGRESDGFAARLDFKDQNYDIALRKLRVVTRVGLGDVSVKR